MNSLLQLPGAPTWFLAVLDYSLQAAALAALIFIVTQTLGRWIPPAFRALLWFLVIARVLIPYAPPSQFSFQNLFAKPPPAIHSPAEAPRAITPIEQEFVLTSSVPVAASNVQPSIAFSIGQILSTAWVLSVAVSILVLLARCLILHFRLARETAQPLPEILASLKCAYPIRISSSEKIIAPALTGLFPARLILPKSIDRFTPTQIDQILRHELAHIQQGHLFLHWLALIARCLHWFNPAIHFAATRLRLECELAADASALANSTPAERTAYGETILQILAQTTATSNSLVLPMAERAQLERRLQAVAQTPRHFRLLGVAALSALTITGLSSADQIPPQALSPVPAKSNLISLDETERLLWGKLETEPKDLLAVDLLPSTKERPYYGVPKEDPERTRLSSVVRDARFKVEHGQRDEAEALLREAIKQDPDNRMAVYYLSLLREQKTSQSIGVINPLDTLKQEKEAQRIGVLSQPEKPRSALTATPFFSTKTNHARAIIRARPSGVLEYSKDKGQTWTPVSFENGQTQRMSPMAMVPEDTIKELPSREKVDEKAQPGSGPGGFFTFGGGGDSEKRNSAPFGNPFSTTNVTGISSARKNLREQLDSIRIAEFPIPKNIDLAEILKDLSSEIKKQYPTAKNINFILATANKAADQIEPNKFQIRLTAPLRNFSVKQILDVILMSATAPADVPANVKLRYSIEDYAVVFSASVRDGTQLFQRIYNLDPSLFRSASEAPVFSANPFEGLVTNHALLRTMASSNGITMVTIITNNSTIQAAVRAEFAKAGVEFPTNQIGQASPPTKALFFNDRAGKLYVRASLDDLDKIEKLLHELARNKP
jgi:beta-lactamase regulating signal transducer with metallopeptidase domain